MYITWALPVIASSGKSQASNSKSAGRRRQKHQKQPQASQQHLRQSTCPGQHSGHQKTPRIDLLKLDLEGFEKLPAHIAHVVHQTESMLPVEVIVKIQSHIGIQD